MKQNDKEVIGDMFTTLTGAKGCATCRFRATAFGVQICREKHPRPDIAKDCKFWNRRGD